MIDLDQLFKERNNAMTREQWAREFVERVDKLAQAAQSVCDAYHELDLDLQPLADEGYPVSVARDLEEVALGFRLWHDTLRHGTTEEDMR